MIGLDYGSEFGAFGFDAFVWELFLCFVVSLGGSMGGKH